uniref:Uncharacterized protein n=1 Tax=Arundo donax TaxID=35708 RepID=A0A0A9DBY9_ARUDO
MDGALNFDVLPDLRRGKSDSEVNKRADKSTLGIMDDPLKFNDFQWGTSTNSIWPEVGKSNSSSVGDPLQFHDLKVGKSGCSTSFIRREVGKSTFGNKGDSLRTGSQIMSLMKPPSQVEYPQSAPYGQPCSLRSSESRMTLDVSRRNNTVVDGSNGTFYASGNSGVSHFATELRTATQSCLSLETPQRKNPVWPHHWTESSGNSHPTNDDQIIMRAPAFEGQETMNGLLAYYISNAKGQRQASSNHHTGSSNDTVPVRNVTSDPGLQQDKSGTTGQQECKSRSQDRRDYRGS